MDISRYEVNRQVKTVLTQHCVNLDLIDYSYIGGTVYLTGTIQKWSSDEFTSLGLDALATDINRLTGVRDVQFDLDNWVLARGRGSWQVMRRTHRPSRLSLIIPQEGGAVSTDQNLDIKGSETIADVLKDIEKKEDKIKNNDLEEVIIKPLFKT